MTRSYKGTLVGGNLACILREKLVHIYPESNYSFSIDSLGTLSIIYWFSWYAFHSLLILLVRFPLFIDSLGTLSILHWFCWYAFHSLLILLVRFSFSFASCAALLVLFLLQSIFLQIWLFLLTLIGTVKTTSNRFLCIRAYTQKVWDLV